MTMAPIWIGPIWRRYPLLILIYRHQVNPNSSLRFTTNDHHWQNQPGHWFAHIPPRDEDEQDDPDDSDGPHRSVPNAKLLNELYAAAGKSKQHMPSLKSLELKLNLDLGEHRFIYYFDRVQQRYTIVVESSVIFEFSDEALDAWGFDKEAVNSFKEGDVNIIEVLL